MALNRSRSNVQRIFHTGVDTEKYEALKEMYPLSFFGYNPDDVSTFTPALTAGKEFIRHNGFGSIYIPPTETYHYPVILSWYITGYNVEMWGARPAIEVESRPYELGAFAKGDYVNNINVTEESVLGWACIEGGSPGVWRVWGDLTRFYSDIEKVEALPIVQPEREGQMVLYEGISYICALKPDGTYGWQQFVFSEEFALALSRIAESEKDIVEINSQIEAIVTGLDWRESVETYNDLATTYPEAEDGWTVNVKDTDITYRYDGNTWIPISSNSIPLATEQLDGKMSKEDKAKLNALSQGFITLLVDGSQVATSNRHKLGLYHSEGSSIRMASKVTDDNDETGVSINPNGVAYVNLSKGQDVLQNVLNNPDVQELIIYQDISSNEVSLSIDKSIRSHLIIRFNGILDSDNVYNLTVVGTVNSGLSLLGDSQSEFVPIVNLVSGKIELKSVDGVKVENKSAEKLVLLSLRDGQLLGGSFDVRAAYNSILQIKENNDVSLGTLFGCEIVAELENNQSYEFEGSGNSISGVTELGSDSHIVCPFDTRVFSEDVITRGVVQVDLTGTGSSLEFIPRIKLSAISLGYFTESQIYKAYIEVDSFAPQDGLGADWSVSFLDSEDTLLTADVIEKLDKLVLGKIDILNKKVLVPRPIPKVWVGPSSEVPKSEDRDTETLYFVY